MDEINNIQPKEKEEVRKGFWQTHLEKLQASALNLLLTVVAAIALMCGVCAIVFFATVKGEEQVMVPDVVGKELGQALLELQDKELYQKVQFRYTDDPDDAGKILTQNPDAGAIVKAGRRINLTVSKGVIVDHVGNYVGEMLDDVKIALQTMFAGSVHPLIVLSEPSYKSDKSPAGTIIAQDPPEGTPITSPVKVKLIVSRGSEFETTKVPNVVGLSLGKMLTMMASSKIVFDFVPHIALEGERAGTVTKQQSFDSQYVKNYTHMEVEVALPSEQDKDVQGIFTANISRYPYAVSMSLVAAKDGKRTTLVSFEHTGGKVNVPYVVEHETELTLYVAEKQVAREFVD